jgi:hypothetical protein
MPASPGIGLIDEELDLESIFLLNPRFYILRC